MADETVRAYVGLGANLGDTVHTLGLALKALAALPKTHLRRASSFVRSEALGTVGPDYLNAVAELDTELSAKDLLAELQRIEDEAGRERPFKNAPRTLDLDLLLHGDTKSKTKTLTLPHPRMHERAFVLLPLAELSPEIEIPGKGPIIQLLSKLADQRVSGPESS